MRDHLLPSNASDLEIALDQATARIGDVPVPIRDLHDPQRTPSAFMPWLAWAWSIDYWDETWSEAQKRAAIAQAYWLHRRKGTLAGVKGAVRLLAGDFVRAITPPNTAHLGANWGEADRRSFLGRHPELRVYPHRDRAPHGGLIPGIISGTARAHLTSRLRDTPVRSDAARRLMPDVVLVAPDGTETSLVTQSWTTQSETYREVDARFTRRTRHRNGAMLSAVHLGGPRAYPADTKPAQSIYTARFVDRTKTTGQTPATSVARPSLKPIDVQSDLKSLPAPVQGGMAGATWVGARNAHLVDQYAGARMYRTTHLLDPDVPVADREIGPVAHVGCQRLGMPAHHAEIQATIREQRHRLSVHRHVAGHVIASPKARLTALMRVLRNTVPARDRVVLQTAITQKAKAGRSRRAGDLVAGQWIKG